MTTGGPGRFKAVLGISFAVFGAFTVTLGGFTGDSAGDINRKHNRKFRSDARPGPVGVASGCGIRGDQVVSDDE